MNKIFSLSLGLLLVVGTFSSCVKSEEDDIFDKSAAERLNEVSGTYSARLAASKGGWAMQYYATTDTVFPRDNGYVLLAKFNEDNSVNMAMNNSFSSNKYIEDTSMWDVITDDGPVLTFNTYSKVMHAFSNPEDLSQTSDDETGKGAQGDYEFVMVDVPENGEYVMLKGKKRGSYTYLTPLPEGTDFQEYMTDLKTFTNKLFPSTAPNSFLLTVGDSTHIVEHLNTSKAMTTMYPQGGDKILEISRHPNLITKRDGKYYLRFRNAIKGKNNVSAQEFVYDETADRFVDVNDAANYLESEDMITFFVNALSMRHAYSVSRTTSAMSESVKAAMDNVYNTYHAIKSKYGVNTYSMAYDTEGNFIIKLRYNQSDSNTELRYVFNVTVEDDGTMKLEYQKPANSSAENHFSRVQEVIEGIFSQTFKVSAMYTKFNQGSLKLTSTTDSNCWFELSY